MRGPVPDHHPAHQPGRRRGGRSLHGGPPAASVPLDARRLGCGFHLFCGAFGAGRNVVGQTAVVVAGIAVQPGHGGWSIDEIKPAGPGGWHRARRSRAHTRPLAAKTAIHWQGVVVVSRSERGTERSLGWMLIVQPVLVAALFVTSYPYLWSAPIERTRILFDFRRFEMNNQAGSGRRRPLPRVWKPSSAPGRTSMTGPAPVTASRPPSATRSARTGRACASISTWRCPASCFSSTSPGEWAGQPACPRRADHWRSVGAHPGSAESTSIATTCPCCSPRPSVSGCSLAVLAVGAGRGPKAKRAADDAGSPTCNLCPRAGDGCQALPELRPE